MVCPCGTGIKTGISDDVVYITESTLEAAAGSFPFTKLVALLDPLYGKAINLHDLCSTPPPAPPTATIDWYLDPLSYLEEIYQAVLRITWNQWCECTPCPPIAGCTGSNVFSITVGDAYCPTSEQVPSTDPCYPCQEWQYLIDGAATFYAQRSDGTCYGPFTGFAANWSCPSFDPPNGRVLIGNRLGARTNTWDRLTYGDTITLYMGDGSGGGPAWDWDNGGVAVADVPTPPACDPTTVCTAVSYLYDAVRRIEISQAQQDYFLRGTGGIGTFPLPGTVSEANGTLLDVLRQAFTAIAPIQASQLTSPTTTPVTASGPLSVVGKQFVEILFTAVPNYLGIRGTDAQVYYSNARQPGPGWVLVESAYGIIEYHELIFPIGLQFELPPLATGLVFQLSPGVEISVTTFERTVS